MRRVMLGLAVAVLVGLGGGATAAATTDVPSDIRVPDGNRKIAVMPARGVQTYQCTAGAWGFLQPDAILRYHGRPEVLHSKGPVWTDVADGSSVTGAAQANAPSQFPDSIQQLLLKATANRGPGLLAAVTYIQRLNTRGGLAPTGACTDGTTVSVPYTADYVFWVAR